MKFDSNTITIKHENNFPFGWTTGKIKDLIGEFGLFCDGDWIESKDQDPNGNVRLIQLADIGDGFYRNKSFRFLTKEKAHKLNCTILKPGDLLIARLGEPLGKSCIFPGDEKISVTAVDVCIVRTGESDIIHKWLMYSINSSLFRKAIGSLQSGTTRKRISRKNLAKITFPIPPLQEQRPIVAKIEELFTRLDAGVDALKHVQGQLKRYRQSVLEAAVEGRLTAEWREQHKDELEPADKLLKRIQAERKAKLGKKYKEPTPIDTTNLPRLPDGWMWNYLGNMVEVIMGQAPPGSDCNRDNIGTPFVKVGQFSEKYPEINEWTTNPKKFVDKHDVLICVVGATIGKLNLGIDCSIGRSVAGIRPNGNILSQLYLYHFLKTWTLALRAGSQGSAQGVITRNDINKLVIPLPNIIEQNIIIERIEQMSSISDEADTLIQSELKRAQSLRQSILKRAFEGKLVPQDPNDEPASVLLQRLKAEKTKLKKSKQMEMF